MTGFGRAEAQTDEFLINIEFKSVNHRYFEFNCKCSRQYSFLQDKLKTLAGKYISRGKVECLLSISLLQADSAQVLINEGIASAYVDAFKAVSEKYGVINDVSARSVLLMPEVLTLKKAEIDEEKLSAAVMQTAAEALEKFCRMREAEGERLAADVLEKAELILESVSYIEQRSPEVVKEYNQKLIEKIKELLDGHEPDETRLLQEAAIFADKTAVDEETVRLKSHIMQLRDFVNGRENAVGKKMDFLLQEINREANTIGSKVSDFEMTGKVLDMKCEIEKIREQIQNVE
ncbi:MAG: YicC family protein [Clostridiales bacterium]|nr:YicC family protein [Clostridiales bacterium]